MKTKLILAAVALAASVPAHAQEISNPALRYCVELSNRVEHYANKRQIGHKVVAQFQGALANKRLSQDELLDEIVAIHYAYANYHGVESMPAPAYLGIIAQDKCMRAIVLPQKK